MVAIGFRSLPERDSEVTLQKLSTKRILALGFMNRSLEIRKWA